MNNRTICDLYYENNITKKNANNIFIEGATLYSYGHHFPMAVRVKNDLHIWNESGYSVTTSKHQGYAYPRYRYIPVNTDIIQSWDHAVNNNYDYPKEKTIAYLNKQIEYCNGKREKARSESMKAHWDSEIEKYNKAISYLDELVSENTNGDGNEEDNHSDSMFGTVTAVMKMGELLCDTKKEKNDWKARMLKAGLENKGLIMPEDWDTLSEDEKEKRLNGVMEVLK